jgi:hypothetical protein
MAERVELRALLSRIAARDLVACNVPGTPTVGLAFSRSGTANGDCGIVFERMNESS